jgi:hypothetical protein
MQLKTRVVVLCSLFFLPLVALKAMPIDSIKHNKPANDTTVQHIVTNIYTESMLEPGNIWRTGNWTTDSTLNKLEQYTQRYSLGNPGLPLVPVVFNSAPSPLGFFYGKDYLTDYFYSDSSIRYYNTRAPYLNFFYVSDPQIHQYLDLVLTQNITKKLNAAITFKRIRSEGAFLNQGSNDNQLTVNINYQGKRYLLLADCIYNIFKVDQNGGVQADTDFANPDYIGQRQTVPVYLSTARTTMQGTSLHLRQFYFFGYKSGDTGKLNPAFYISHTLKVAGHSNLYNDQTISQDSAGFYPHFYHDSAASYDSLRYTEVDNDISIGSGKAWDKVMRWEAGATYQWIHFRDYSAWAGNNATPVFNNTDTIITNLMLHARVYNTFANGKLLADVSGSEIVAGTQAGDVQANATLGYKLDSLRVVTLHGSYSYQTPALIYDLYYGNNLDWYNRFNKITTTSASINYADAKWHLMLGGEATQITNYTYFDAVATPQQFPGAINVLKAFIEKDFNVGKWHVSFKEIYQNVPDYEPIRLPQFVSENSLYYENWLFHHAMLLRIGVNVYYNTAFYVYAYMPVTDQYYIQNNTQLGGYAYLDPFLSFRIKTFRFFIKMENITSNLIQTGTFYGYALNYPMPDRVLRFGINWDFWN